MRTAFLVFVAILQTTNFYPAKALSTLEAKSGGGIQHEESGWIFPKKVGKLVRQGKPKSISGTNDVYAKYETGNGDDKIITTVFVYSSKSTALDASYGGAKVAIEEYLRSPFPMAQLWSEGPFTVGKERKFMGRKSFYKGGIGPTSVANNLYHYDTGQWIVKVRMTGREAAKSLAIGDEFVQALPWESLTIPDGSCTGYSCKLTRPVPIHGMIPETLAMMLMEKHALTIDKMQPECVSSEIVASLAAKPKLNAKGLASPFEKVADCKIDKQKIGFVRFVLPPTMLEKMLSSPDGLSFTGPFTFAMIKKGRNVALAELHDGPMDVTRMNEILRRVEEKNPVVFANWDQKKGNMTPVIRFLN